MGFIKMENCRSVKVCSGDAQPSDRAGRNAHRPHLTKDSYPELIMRKTQNSTVKNSVRRRTKDIWTKRHFPREDTWTADHTTHTKTALHTQPGCWGSRQPHCPKLDTGQVPRLWNTVHCSVLQKTTLSRWDPHPSQFTRSKGTTPCSLVCSPSCTTIRRSEHPHRLENGVCTGQLGSPPCTPAPARNNHQSLSL